MKRIALIISVFLALGLAIILAWPDDEPVIQGKPLGFWVEGLTVTRPDERQKAIAAITEGGQRTISRLIDTVRQGESSKNRFLRQHWDMFPGWLKARLPQPKHPTALRIRSAEALKLLGPVAKEAVPALIETLAHPDSALRSASIEALEAIGADARDALPTLTGLLGNKDAGLRMRIGDALKKIWMANRIDIGEALSPLLSDPDPYRQLGAAECWIRWRNEVNETVEHALTTLMENSDSMLRFAAAEALIAVDSGNGSRSKALLILADHPNSGIQSKAFDEMGRLVPMPKAVLNRIAAGLESTNHFTQSIVLRALAGAQKPNKGEENLIEKVEQLSRSADGRVQFDALWVLRSWNKLSPERLKELIETLETSKDSNLQFIIGLIAQMGVSAKEAVPFLTSVLTNDAKGISANAAVPGYSPGGWKSILIGQCAYALGQIGPDASEAIPALSRFLSDSDFRLRIQAADALCRISPEARPMALATLTNELTNPPTVDGPFSPITGQNHLLAATALANLGYKEQPVVEMLKRMLKDPNWGVSFGAAQCLFRLDPSDAEAFQHIMRSLELQHAAAPQVIVRLLREVGTNSPIVSSALQNAMQHTNPVMRTSIRRVLNKLQASQ